MTQYDYDIMATLTKNTAGSLKKMWPPIKRKAMDAHPTFSKFLNGPGAPAANGDAKPAPAPKATGGKKRKATDEDLDDADEDTKDTTSAANKSDGNKSDSKKKPAKKAPATKGKGRAKKQVKKEEPASEDEVAGNSGENGADSGDGLGKLDSYANTFDSIKYTN